MSSPGLGTLNAHWVWVWIYRTIIGHHSDPPYSAPHLYIPDHKRIQILSLWNRNVLLATLIKITPTPWFIGLVSLSNIIRLWYLTIYEKLGYWKLSSYVINILKANRHSSRILEKWEHPTNLLVWIGKSQNLLVSIKFYVLYFITKGNRDIPYVKALADQMPPRIFLL